MVRRIILDIINQIDYNKEFNINSSCYIDLRKNNNEINDN
jgi:hypothetical protein